MRKTLTKKYPEFTDSINAFLDSQQAALIDKIQTANAALNLKRDDSSFDHLGARVFAMPAAVPVVTADPSGAI